MKKSLRLAVIASMVGIMAFAAGCGGNKSADPDVLKVGVTKFADTLEPTDNYFAWVVMRYGVGEGLVKFDNKMNPEPWLATSWSISDDKLTWTFIINDKATFSNGNKVTAEAVKKSIERVFEKSNRAKTFFTYTSMEANGQELKIHTEKPTAGLPGILADPLFLIIDTSDTSRDIAKQGPIGTGPYVVESFTPEKTVLKANEHYWNGKVPYKTVEIPSIDDPNTRAMALQSGEVDIAVNIAPGDMPLFADSDKFKISEIASLRDVLASMNVAPGKPLNDIRVRKALISALDRETYNKVLLKDKFLTGKAPVPPSLDYGFDQINDENTYNVERAKQLLAEAGYKDTDGDGIVEKDGQPLTLNFVYYTSRAELGTYAEATQADAKKVGIDVKLQNVDYNVLDGMREKGEFDLMISNIITAGTGDPEKFLNQYWKSNINGSNPQNGSGYSNPEFDAISDQLSSEFDPAKRKELIIKMQQIIMKDAVTIFFGYPKTNMISSSGVIGAEITPADYYWVNVAIKAANK